MSPTLIIRLEDAAGVGPYMSGIGYLELIAGEYNAAQDSHPDGRPTPDCDRWLRAPWVALDWEAVATIRFGFASTESMLAWFPLAGNPNHVQQPRRYLALRVLHGERQVAFDSESALRLEEET